MAIKKDKDLLGIDATAKELEISRDLLLKEFADGKIKATLRGTRKKFSRAQREEYKENQIVDNSDIGMEDYVPKYIKKISGVLPAAR